MSCMSLKPKKSSVTLKVAMLLFSNKCTNVEIMHSEVMHDNSQYT